MRNSGRRGQEEENEMKNFCTLSIGQKSHSHRTQDECCYVCGHKGFSELLVYCSDCSQFAIHKYCLGIIPGSIDDKEDVYWACEDCCQLLNPATNKTEMILFEEEPKPICTLFPSEYQNNSEEEYEPYVSYVMEHPAEISRGVVLLVSPSGEIIIQDEMSLFDDLSDSLLVSPGQF